MTKVNCPFVMCKHNSSHVAATPGLCKKEDITVSFYTDNGEDITMQCNDAEWDNTKPVKQLEGDALK